MKGGLPLGGIYSGPGIDPAAGFFNPSFAAEGPNIVTYTYTNNDLCSSSGFITIQVFPSPGFTCGNDLTDIRDNQTYSTFSLPGGKCWMAANMNFGNQIPAVQYQADNCQVEKYCSGDSLVNCNLYGGLYQWDEAMQYEITSQSNGICPPGWHIPNSADWEGLIDFYGTAGLAGDPMKDLSNPAGFRALLHGIYYFNSTWYLSGGPYKAAMYWSSTTDGNLRSLARGINHHTQSVSLYSSLKNNAIAVRCIRD